MDPLIAAVSLLVAASAVLIILGVQKTATAEASEIEARVSGTRRLRAGQSGGLADVTVQSRQRGFFMALDRPLERFSWADRARADLRKAELNLHLSEFVGLRLLTAGPAVFLIAWVGGSVLALLIAVAAGIFIWWLPGMFVRRRINRRQHALEASLDSMLTHISGSLRAGFGFLQACQMAIEQLEWPLKNEMEETLEEVSVGASIEEALQNLARRVESYEMDITVNAVLVQRSTGGNLSQVLDSVARTIRDRRELRGHIMALTAQQRLSAIFVAGVPVFMTGLLSLMNWKFMHPLFTTTTGNFLLAAGAIFDMIGFLVMRRLTKIDF